MEKTTVTAEKPAKSPAAKKNVGKAKISSLVAQIIAAIWVALWCGMKFYKEGGAADVTDIILSGFAIAACFSPVYFSMIMDKIKNIRFGDKTENIEMEQ